MKKRLLSLFIVLAMLCAMSISASAVTQAGRTSGGTRGMVTTSASLIMSRIQAEAFTSSAINTSILRTTVNFTYTNEMDQTATMSDSGYASAVIMPDDMKDIQFFLYATSQHTVEGGTDWGSWSCTLSESR